VRQELVQNFVLQLRFPGLSPLLLKANSPAPGKSDNNSLLSSLAMEFTLRFAKQRKINPLLGKL